MIVELTVENIAIVERAQVRLGPGFTALTGETGAGKSLIVDALELALGARADAGLVRSGAARATVSLTADLTASKSAQDLCADLGVELEAGLLFIQRELAAEGRSTCRLGGRLAPVATLRQIGAALADLHGQHEHQSLLDPARHAGYLDAWIGAPAAEAAARVSEAYAWAATLRERLRLLRSQRRDREQRLDLLRFQIAEIEAVSPQAGEYEEAQARLSRLQNAERLAQAAFGALNALSDTEGSAHEALGAALKDLASAERLDARIAAALEPLRQAEVFLDEGVRELRAYAEGIGASPEALEQAAARLDGLRRLRRKYGEDEAAVVAFLKDARDQLDALEDPAAGEEALVPLLSGAEEALFEAARALSELRRDRAREFASLVQSQLRELAMERARFEVAFRPREIDAAGADDVEFFFSANAGEAPRALGRIASGGEISRVMLAIKVVLAGRAGVPTLVFDEVEAGLGGRAAAVVARKLEELAQHAQVIVISHLPQIAGRATTHFRIEKATESGRAVTRVRALEGEDRVEEIARMLAGERVGASALANARELLRIA
jgi:DNA repair protein RecN (Recombination protein N)